MIAYCGLNCLECPAYMATQNNDEALRAETARKWSEEFGGSFSPEDIQCNGCLAVDGHFQFCQRCEIRTCGSQKALVNCGHCETFPCERLDKFLQPIPAARANLEASRSGK